MQRWPGGPGYNSGGTQQPLLVLTQMVPQKEPWLLMAAQWLDFPQASQCTPAQAKLTPSHRAALDWPQLGKRRVCVLHLNTVIFTYRGRASHLCKHTIPLALVRPSFGQRSQYEEKEKLKGNSASLTLTLRTFAPVTWEQIPPWKGGDSHWEERKSFYTPLVGSSSSITNSTPYQGDICQNTLKKDMTDIHNKSVPPKKGIGHLKSA